LKTALNFNLVQTYKFGDGLQGSSTATRRPVVTRIKHVVILWFTVSRSRRRISSTLWTQHHTSTELWVMIST